MRKSHWLWLPLVGASVYLAGQLRAPDTPGAAVGIEIHALFGLATPDASALAEMLYAQSPELRDRIIISAAEEPDHFVIASIDPDPAAALAHANAAAESLQGVLGEHFKTGLDEKLGKLQSDIEAQKEKVEESRRKMLEIMAQNAMGGPESDAEDAADGAKGG
jgi:hypothetical protein